jgi:mannose-6-phosphate isomerase-like protein (cupin superfamily)
MGNVPEITVPQIVQKGWGTETIIHNSSLYCGKVLTIKKGYEGSQHSHGNKTESWLLFEGLLNVTFIDPETAAHITYIFNKGQTVHIPKWTSHKMTAIEDSIIFEVSTFHEDSDTYRVRKGSSQK